jgi:type IV secretory pathway VirB6-like protein
VASTSSVGDGKLGDGWGTTKVGCVQLSTRGYDTTIETIALLSCPTLSVHRSSLVGLAATHRIGTCGHVLVAIGWVAAVAAVVAEIQIVSMRPAVVQILVPLAGRPRHVLVVLIVVLVVVIGIVAVVVIGIVVVVVIIIVVVVASSGGVGPAVVVVIVVVAIRHSCLELLKLRS